MSEATLRHPMTLKPVVLALPGMDAVSVRRGLPYREGNAGSLTLDVWTPAGSAQNRGAVVFLSGYPDPAFEQRLGCKLMTMEAHVSWARLLAASGMVAVTYENREPANDFAAVLQHIHEHASDLGVDRDRIGVWACSGNVPTALHGLLSDAAVPVACAVLLYGYMFDVAAAAAQVGFADPTAGRSVANLRPAPLLVVRAGQDQTSGLNASIDAFVAAALGRDLPLTVVNHAGTPHAFDLLDDSAPTHDVIRGVLGFLRARLG